MTNRTEYSREYKKKHADWLREYKRLWNWNQRHPNAPMKQLPSIAPKNQGNDKYKELLKAERDWKKKGSFCTVCKTIHPPHKTL